MRAGCRLGAGRQEHSQGGSSCMDICPQEPQAPHPHLPLHSHQKGPLFPTSFRSSLKWSFFRCWHQPALKDLHHPLLDAGKGMKFGNRSRELSRFPTLTLCFPLTKKRSNYKLVPLRHVGFFPEQAEPAEPMPRPHLSLFLWHMKGCEGLEVDDVWEFILLHQHDAPQGVSHAAHHCAGWCLSPAGIQGETWYFRDKALWVTLPQQRKKASTDGLS